MESEICHTNYLGKTACLPIQQLDTSKIAIQIPKSLLECADIHISVDKDGQIVGVSGMCDPEQEQWVLSILGKQLWKRETPLEM